MTDATEPPRAGDDQATASMPAAATATPDPTSPSTEPSAPEAPASPETQPTEATVVQPPAEAPTDAETPQPAAEETQPTAETAAPIPAKPSFRERGRMRRRLRYLRKLRELQARDLGGLVFDLRRFERKRDDLVTQKLDRLRACDDELRALEVALDERRVLRDVREPGIGGTCPRCFAIYGSTDRFCASCGAALGGAVQGPAQIAPPPPIRTLTPPEPGTPAPGPATPPDAPAQ